MLKTKQEPMTTRTAILKGVLVGAFLMVSGVVIVDCSHRDAPPGLVKLDLKVSTSSKVDTLTFEVSGNGLAPPITGLIDVSKSMTAGTTVRGIPAGRKYSVQIDGTSTDGLVSCSGKADVDVVSSKTTQINVILLCSDTRSTGTVSINGTFDNCPAVTSLMASPMAAPVKGTIELQAMGLDLDGDSLTFKWRDFAGIGTFGATTMPSSRAGAVTFTCGSIGVTTLSAIASDGTCDDKSSVTVNCTDPGVAGPGVSGGNTGSGNTGAGNTGVGNMPGTGTGGSPGTGNMSADGTGGMMVAQGGSTGNGAGGGMGMMMGGAGMTGSGSGAMMGSMGGGPPPFKGSSDDCKKCSFGPQGDVTCDADLGSRNPTETCGNCSSATDGCDYLTDANDKTLCNDLVACALNAQPACILKGNQGDLIPCWCGTNATTCVSANSGATKANGPCLAQIVAAAHQTPDTYDAPTIKMHLTDPALPLGRAVNVLLCQGTFCNSSCGIW